MADEAYHPDTEKVTEPTAADVEDYDAAEDDDVAPVDEVDESKSRLARLRHRASHRRLSRVATALVASAAVVAVLSGLAGWVGYRAYEKHQAQGQRELFLQVARQGAVNLTSINYTEVDADVQRIP